MSRDASVTLHFGDAEHLFRLRIGQLLELQDKINRPRIALMAAAGIEQPPLIGPRTILELIGRGDLWPHELREILRIGLTGGGMKPAAVELLLRDHYANYALGDLSAMAGLILAAAVAGEEAAPVGKGEAAGQAAQEPAAATGSTSAHSMAAASSSVSTPAPSTTSRSPNLPP